MKARTANKKGAVVRFRVSATDLVDAAIVPVCSPASSTLFRVGVTRVDCTATDRGQNVARASFTVSVKLVRKARQVALFSPAAGEVVSTAPRLAWRRAPKATYYNVQLFRGGHQILSAWPSRPRLQLHDAWTHHGRRMLLSPGKYVWFVSLETQGVPLQSGDSSGRNDNTTDSTAAAVGIAQLRAKVRPLAR